MAKATVKAQKKSKAKDNKFSKPVASRGHGYLMRRGKRLKVTRTAGGTFKSFGWV